MLNVITQAGATNNELMELLIAELINENVGENDSRTRMRHGVKHL